MWTSRSAGGTRLGWRPPCATGTLAAGAAVECMRCEGDVWRALGMFTTGAAYSDFREGRKGVVAPGAQADLIVVDRDPTAIAPEEVRRVKAQATILAGDVAHGDLGAGWGDRPATAGGPSTAGPGVRTPQSVY